MMPAPYGKTGYSAWLETALSLELFFYSRERITSFLTSISLMTFISIVYYYAYKIVNYFYCISF